MEGGVWGSTSQIIHSMQTAPYLLSMSLNNMATKYGCCMSDVGLTLYCMCMIIHIFISFLLFKTFDVIITSKINVELFFLI